MTTRRSPPTAAVRRAIEVARQSGLDVTVRVDGSITVHARNVDLPKTVDQHHPATEPWMSDVEA
jgi:hypothetical protein